MQWQYFIDHIKALFDSKYLPSDRVTRYRDTFTITCSCCHFKCLQTDRQIMLIHKCVGVQSGSEVGCKVFAVRLNTDLIIKSLSIPILLHEKSVVIRATPMRPARSTASRSSLRQKHRGGRSDDRTYAGIWTHRTVEQWTYATDQTKRPKNTYLKKICFSHWGIYVVWYTRQCSENIFEFEKVEFLSHRKRKLEG